jgi:hypothetical protein
MKFSVRRFSERSHGIDTTRARTWNEPFAGGGSMRSRLVLGVSVLLCVGVTSTANALTYTLTEPSTWAMLLLGFAGIMAYRQRLVLFVLPALLLIGSLPQRADASVSFDNWAISFNSSDNHFDSGPTRSPIFRLLTCLRHQLLMSPNPPHGRWC